MTKPVIFVCVHNAGRSQMAQAFFNHLAAQRGLPFRAESAGTMPGERVNPVAVEVMAECGISMEGQRPQLLTPELAGQAERLITMGCGVNAESCPAGTYFSEDWGLDDPHGQPLETVRAIRDQVRVRVETLLDELQDAARE